MTRPRILIVDDKPNMRRLCTALLEDRYEVEAAEDGAAALARIDAGSFDVVVTDIRMPVLDGMALLEHIRQRDPHIQVILITAYGSIEGAVDAMRSGAIDYLSKPFDPDAFEAAVARAIERRRAWLRTEAPPQADAEEPPPAAGVDPRSLSYREALSLARDRTSRQYISAILRLCEGNVTRAADLAGLERESVHRLMRRYGIRAEDFRSARDAESGSEEDGPP